MTNQTSKIVNYAFLQELKEENTPLWEDVLLLGSYGQEPFSGDWIEQNAGTLLRRLRDRLAGQFRMEETLAYIPVEGITQSAVVTKALNQHLQFCSIVLRLAKAAMISNTRASSTRKPMQSGKRCDLFTMKSWNTSPWNEDYGQLWLRRGPRSINPVRTTRIPTRQSSTQLNVRSSSSTDSMITSASPAPHSRRTVSVS